MVLRVCVFGFVIIFLGTPVSTCCKNYAKTKACEAVFSPDPSKISCCPAIDEYVLLITQCQEKLNTNEFTCAISQCVLNLTGILTNNKLDEAKIKGVLDKLSSGDPASKPSNEIVEKNCLNGQYKQYITTDRECETMKYQICAYVNYLMGCQKFKTSPCSCKTLSENVKTCKPFLQQYLKQINSS